MKLGEHLTAILEIDPSAPAVEFHDHWTTWGDLASIGQQLDALLGQIQTNATYQRVLVANENFDKVMVQVNQWILDGIKKGAVSSIITLA